MWTVQPDSLTPARRAAACGSGATMPPNVRQEAGVDVEDAPGKAVHDLVAEDGLQPGEGDEVRAVGTRHSRDVGLLGRA